MWGCRFREWLNFNVSKYTFGRIKRFVSVGLKFSSNRSVRYVGDGFMSYTISVWGVLLLKTDSIFWRLVSFELFIVKFSKVKLMWSNSIIGSLYYIIYVNQFSKYKNADSQWDVFQIYTKSYINESYRTDFYVIFNFISK